jgi:hypothetical protein
MWANGNSVVEKYNNWNGKSTRESHQVWADKKKGSANLKTEFMQSEDREKIKWVKMNRTSAKCKTSLHICIYIHITVSFFFKKAIML